MVHTAVSLTDREREERLTQLMAGYQTSLMRMAYLYLGDAALAEDAVQETFLKAYAHLDTFRGDSSEKTWLMRIAINTCKDMRRTAWLKWRRLTLSWGPACDQGKCDRYRDDTVLSAVMGLPPRDKQVILLRFYQEMKVTQIAQVLGVPEANAASRLKRAKDKLRKALKGWYFDEE